MASRIRAVLGVLIVTWILLEIAANVLVRLEIKPYINEAIGALRYPDGNYVAGSIDFDSIHGYRITECPWRYLRVAGGILVFDTETCMNDAGFRDEDEFDPVPAAGTQRIFVLGDSFTHMWYADRSWPEMLETDLSNSRVYNLARAGTGIGNWFSVYHGFVKHLEYDVLIIAIFAVDMKRDFTVADVSDDELLFGRFEMPPRNREEYEALFDKKMNPVATRISYAQADSVAAAFTGAPPLRPDFYFYKIVRSMIEGRLSFFTFRGSGRNGEEDSEETFPENDDALASLADYSGPRRASHLAEIVADARAAGVRVVLASVPGRHTLLRYLEGQPDPFDTLLRRLGDTWDVDYFSGYAPFDGVSSRTVNDTYWLINDGHWSEAGAGRFADAMASHLQRLQNDSH